MSVLLLDTRRRGHPPTFRDWQRATESTPSASLVAIRFGSWSAALRAAGLPVSPAGGARQDRCRRGHPLTEDNVYVAPSGERQCRTCHRDRARQRARRRRRAAEWQKELRRRRREQGLCRDCGDEAPAGRTRCEHCRELNLERTRARRRQARQGGPA